MTSLLQVERDGLDRRELAAAVVPTAAAILLARFAIVLPVGVWLALGVTIGIAQRRWFLPLLLLVLLAARATAAVDALAPAATRPVVDAQIVLLEDPRSAEFGDRARVVAHGEVVLATFAPNTGAIVASAQSGDALLVSGTLRGRAPSSGWEVSRGLVGRLAVSEVKRRTPADGIRGLANDFRELLSNGTGHLGHDRQALFMGLAVGDDRGQSVITADNFRAAGLGHLLAVSGQNVVFVLIVANSFVSRIRAPAGRVAVSMSLLVFFGFVTRFEPSVTRAITMISLALVANAVGRPATARRTIPVAVVAILFVEPLLAWSLAFQLSVLATLGLIVVSPAVEARLTGPPAITQILSATIGAQAAVAPLLIFEFGHVPILSLLANVLAVPPSGLVMMWGMLVGPVAGLAPGSIASLLHLPTEALLWWIAGVAEAAASIPSASLGAASAGLVGLAAALQLWSSRRYRIATATVLAMALLVPTLTPRELPDGRHRLADGVEVLRSHDVDVLVIEGDADAADAIEAVRMARLGRIDLLIATDGSRRVGRVVRILDERFAPTDLWAPPGHAVPGARTVSRFVGEVGQLEVVVDGPERWLG